MILGPIALALVILIVLVKYWRVTLSLLAGGFTLVAVAGTLLVHSGLLEL